MSCTYGFHTPAKHLCVFLSYSVCVFVFQWLKSVVSLQTSIAQFLTKKQLERNNSIDSCKASESAKMEKPTASVQPVQNRDLMDQSSSILDQSSSNPVSDLKYKNSGYNDCSVPNGPLVSTCDTKVNNGHLNVTKGAVSLLNPSCSSSLNGDIEMAEPTRSKSDYSSGTPDGSTNVVKLTWPGSDKHINVSSNSQTSGSRNIVISTVNKTNNVYTRVVPAIPGKLAGQTSILSTRAGNQAGKQGSTILKSNIVSGSSSTKVIAVNQSQTGNWSFTMKPVYNDHHGLC